MQSGAQRNPSLRQYESDRSVERDLGSFLALDPEWTDEFMAYGVGIYGSGVLPPKEVELLSIAFDASYTHMYAPGTPRQIVYALKAGATMQEIIEVLKLCVAQGMQACNLDIPILAEELKRLEPNASNSRNSLGPAANP